ncbi:MAG TPA: hypothetical protein VI524_12425 [Anaerolineales bacterium]|nr:hypothetical protein [Anaerolineales bacterium]
MNIKSLFINLGKLLLCGVIFSIGAVIGGMVVTMLGLQAPPMPEGMDPQSAMLFMILESPLLALVLALLARYLAGGFWARTLMLFLLTWISNSVNTQIEAAAFAGMEEGFWFTVITFLFPALSASMAVAWLFPLADKNTFMNSVRSFFSRHSFGGWAWRIALGAVIFMPIYYFFGTLVIPFTRSYYEQNMYGLEIPSLDKLLLILFIRSVLFFLACLPILIAWQGSRSNLFWRLGLALFYFVGFQSLLIANWMPWSLRLPHMIEILFDEFVYAGALVWLTRK